MRGSHSEGARRRDTSAVVAPPDDARPMTPSSRRRAQKRRRRAIERRSRVRPLPALGVRVRSLARSFPRARSDPLAPAAATARPSPTDTHPHPAPPTQMRRTGRLATLVRDLRRLVPRDGPSTRPPRDRDPPRDAVWAPRSSARVSSVPRRSRRIATRRSRRSRSDRASSRSPSSIPLYVARTSETLWSRSRSTGATPRSRHRRLRSRAPFPAARQTRPPEPAPPRLPPLAPRALVGRLQIAPARGR